MRVIVDANGRVVACGETAGLVPPAGGQVIEADIDPLAGLAAGEAAVWDGAAFVVRQRTLSAEETAFRDDVQAVKTFMAAPNGSATDTQRDAVFKATIRVMRRVVAELRDE